MNYDQFLGIDPGRQGALVLLSRDGEVLSTQVMPATVQEIINWLETFTMRDRTFVMIEKAQAMPGNGGVGMFNYGRGFGEILGALAALKRPFQLVTPQSWTKIMHAGIEGTLKPKEKSLKAALQLFPTVDLFATKRCTTRHDGIVDALLIAAYGLRTHRLN